MSLGAEKYGRHKRIRLNGSDVAHIPTRNRRRWVIDAGTESTSIRPAMSMASASMGTVNAGAGTMASAIAAGTANDMFTGMMVCAWHAAVPVSVPKIFSTQFSDTAGNHKNEIAMRIIAILEVDRSRRDFRDAVDMGVL